MNFSEALEHIVDTACSKRLSLCVGSGISVGRPACRPLADELKFCILEGICSSVELRQLYEHRLRTEKDIGGKIRTYPLEAFIERISENYDILGTIAEIFRGGSPNKNHIIIARLLENGFVREILTTNFDLLLEKALVSIGWRIRDDFNVYCTEKQFREIDFDSRLPTIFKIHGSADDQESIRVTLRLVASQTLSESRARILDRYLVSGEGDILILGYGARDDFDINPVLSRLSSKKRVFYVRHESCEPIVTSELPEAFRNFEGNTIRCHTDEVVDYLWRALLDE